MSTIPEIEAHFEDVTRRRRPAGSYISGRWVDGGVPVDATIRASVQPASGRDLLRLPEGLRTSDAVTILTTADLRTADETAKVDADRIVHLGEEYEVVGVEKFAMGQLDHLDCMAVRVDRQGAA